MSSRSWSRSAGGSATSAASTTPRRRSASWPPCGSRSSSTPKNLRSDLLEQFRKSRPADDVELPPGTYEFEDTTLYDTHRGLLRTIRRLLNPVLKLFFNPNMLVNVLHQQANLNRHFVRDDDPGARRSRGLELALLRGAAQPRAGDHALQHRAQEPQDARRSAVEPARLLGAARPRPRGRGAVPTRGGGAARAAGRAGRIGDRQRRAGGRAGHRGSPPAAAGWTATADGAGAGAADAVVPASAAARADPPWVALAATPVTTAAMAAMTAATTRRSRARPRPTRPASTPPPPDADPLAS